jgi:hypothetical protein
MKVPDIRAVQDIRLKNVSQLRFKGASFMEEAEVRKGSW